MNEISWGMHFNDNSIYRHFDKTQRPLECPDWLTSNQINTWQEQGFVLWNNIDKKIVALNGGKSLELLRHLESVSIAARYVPVKAALMCTTKRECGGVRILDL